VNQLVDVSELRKRAGSDEVIAFMESHGFRLYSTEHNQYGCWFKESKPQMTEGFQQAKYMYNLFAADKEKAVLDGKIKLVESANCILEADEPAIDEIWFDYDSNGEILPMRQDTLLSELRSKRKQIDEVFEQD
jgi:hypothetical protein